MNIKQLIKKYNKWNIRKQEMGLSLSFDNKYFKEGEIWWCSLGLNIGNESYGKGDDFRRPVLIIRKLSSDLCIGLPLTSKIKIGTWFTDITLDNQKVFVMLYQIRALNKKRFSLKMGQLNAVELNNIKEKLKHLLKLF